MSFRIVLIVFLLLIVSCSSPIKKQSDSSLTLVSQDYKFIDEFLYEGNEKARNIEVWLTLPDSQNYKPPYPAVVLLHSSWGLSSQEWLYASEFKQMGIATFAIDSFSPRGVGKTSQDQMLVSSASMLQDAYATLEYINNHSQFDHEKVAIMGFSKGGSVALYSAIEKIKNAATAKPINFTAHIAYYPWCGMTLSNMKTTGAPVLIQAGGKDIVTPIKVCKELIDKEFSDQDRLNISINEYPKARHAFDHPTLSKIPFPISLTAQVPADCRIRERSPQVFYEEHYNIPVNQDNIGEVLRNCSKYTGVAGYNKSVASQALLETKEFLRIYLLN